MRRRCTSFSRRPNPAPGDSSDITWNFEKFLVDKEGNVVERYAPPTTPEEVAPDLARYL